MVINALFERFAPPYFVFVLILNNLYSLERSELEYKWHHVVTVKLPVSVFY